jgi:hypothetical protein
MAFEYLVWYFSVPGPIRGSSMQIACSVNSLGPDVYGGLRIKHHGPGLLGYDSDHPFRNSNLVLRM